MTKSEAKAISATASRAIHVLAGVNRFENNAWITTENFPWLALDDEHRAQGHAALRAVQDALHYILDMASAELDK